jgi:hypothetical protein
MPNSIATQTVRQEIDLSCPLSFRTAFRFPLQSSLARSEIIQGALWLFVPGFGWLLNMGHRIVMTHRMQHGLPAWPAWTDYGALFRHGAIAFLGMAEYHAPAVICGFLAWRFSVGWLYVVAALLWVIATIAVPGYMSHYCFQFDAQEVFNPFRALSRVFQGRMAYWRAWSIALAGLAISFAGLLALGVGFLFTSVWFWQVAGFSFATVFTQGFGLTGGESETR